MNRSMRNLYLLVALLSTTSCFAVAERHDDVITRSWPASSIHRLELNEVNGSVEIAAGPVDTISLVAHVRARGVKANPTKENKGYFESTVEGDTLSIGRREHRQFRIPFIFSTHDVSVDYEIKVPPQLDLELRTVNGRIATRGTSGEMDAVTVNGAIDLETAGSREISARTVNGRVKARFLQTFQGATFKTVNGGVKAVLPNSASFACNLSQVNGDFEAAFPLNIHSRPGSRRVSGEVNGGEHELRIVTVNGDVEIDSGSGSMAIPAIPQVPPLPAAPSNVPNPPAVPATPPAPPSWST
jgi:Putative adhesin